MPSWPQEFGTKSDTDNCLQQIRREIADCNYLASVAWAKSGPASCMWRFGRLLPHVTAACKNPSTPHEHPTPCNSTLPPENGVVFWPPIRGPTSFPDKILLKFPRECFLLHRPYSLGPGCSPCLQRGRRCTRDPDFVEDCVPRTLDMFSR